MATVTTLINAQSIGTSTNKGNNLFSINPVAFQTSTTSFYLDCKLANGATAGDVDTAQAVMIRYSITHFTVTAAEAPFTLGKTSRYVKLIPRPGASKESITQSSLEVGVGAASTGANILLWVDAPTFAVAGTLTVLLVELP